MNTNEIYRMEQMIRGIESLNQKCDQNMRSLNTMMLELKGVIASVRASARKNDWYKTEINPVVQDMDEILEITNNKSCSEIALKPQQ